MHAVRCYAAQHSTSQHACRAFSGRRMVGPPDSCMHESGGPTIRLLLLHRFPILNPVGFALVKYVNCHQQLL